MAVPIRLSLVFLLLVCLFTLVLSFNLEPRIPVIKTGSPTTHFGYTVAQHQTLLESTIGRTRRKSWLLVGAPKGNNLQPGTNRSGALYKCPLTTLPDDCEQVLTDGFKMDDSILLPPSEEEIKDDQWLGVTLKSQGAGGKVLVCAHRYMSKGRGFQWGFGICYILTQALDVYESMEPCRGKPVGQAHQQYGFCQAGTSGLLLDNEVVLGVPGPYTWRGTVHTANISENFLLRDKTQYFGPVTENDSPVDKYSYLGYSVAAGRFFGSHISYVGGAPRANGTGQVVFFSREKLGVAMLNVELIINGEEFASSFGYEILAVDINGDDRDDLIVGAPFYSKGSASGAIYVYMNNEGGFVGNHPFKKIEGKAGETRFGFSMTTMGDLNHDGFKDVAIGAPYEDQGVIYVFLGTADGLMKDPAQIIRAEDMPGHAYDAFGYSLSGGMDLDNNGYPDLLTSSFCSDRVVLLRARPIIDIETKVESDGQLENIDPGKPCHLNPNSPETCFSFRACFKMDNTAGTRTYLQLKYKIEERVYKDRPIPRVRFADGDLDRPSQVERRIGLRPEDMGRFQCTLETAYLLDGPRDILRPLRFKMSYEINQEEPAPVQEGDPLPDIDEYPILNQQEAVRYFEGTFAKDCGNDDICVSDLNVDGWLVLERAPGDTHYILRLGEHDNVNMFVEVNNTGEPAYQSSLIITHHKALLYDSIQYESGSYQCTRSSKPMIVCGIGNPLTDTTGRLHLTFIRSGEPFDSRFIEFTVAVNSSSVELTEQDPLRFRVEVIKRAEISIIGSVLPEQVFYGGEVVGESAIEYLEQIGMEVTHKYNIDNGGPSRVDEFQVEVEWPHQVENGKEKGKWLLYMTEPPIVDGVGECEVDDRMINPLGYRRHRVINPEIEHEPQVSPYPSPGEVEPEVSGPEETWTGGSVTVNRTVTVTTKKDTKKDTNIYTKKTTSKTYDKEIKTSSSSSSSSSSSGGSSTSSSGTYSSNFDEMEGSNVDSGRDLGRTHVRYSRRVSSSSDDRSRFDESDFTDEGHDKGEVLEHYDRTHTSSGVSPDGRTRFHQTHRETKKVTVEEDSDPGYGEYDFTDEGDDEGEVLEHYDRTHTSSGVSPDGRTRFHQTHRKTKKVTVKEESGSGHGEIPLGRWSEGGGYRRTHTSSSSTSSSSSSSGSRTHTGEPDERTQWRSHGETDTEEGSGSFDTHRHGQTWREGSHTRRVESSVHRTNTGGYEEGRDVDGYRAGYGEERRTSHMGETRMYGGSTRTNTDHDGRAYEGHRQGTWREETSGYGGERGYERTSPESWREGSYSRTYEYKSNRRQGSTDDDRYGKRRNQGSWDYDRTSEGHRYSSSQGRSWDRHEGDGTIVDERNRDRFGSDGHTEDQESRRRVFDWADRDRGHGYGDTSESHRRAYSDDGSRRDYNYRESEIPYDRSHHGGGARRTNHGTTSSRDRDRSWSHGDGFYASTGRIHYDSGHPIENATYQRVEVDPETGDTVVYTRRVYHNRNFEQNPSDFGSSVRHEEESVRNRRDLVRVKREKEMVIKPQAVTDQKTGKTLQVVHLKCDGTPTAKCFVFRCNIRNLGAKQAASIRIKSRLWNATLVEDYPRVSYVSIKSRASVILPEDIREDQDQSDDVDSAETLAYPDLLDQLPPEEVPLWVILVSIFAGLLVLIIIVLILWKLGFFERKRPDPTLSGNLDKDANGY